MRKITPDTYISDLFKKYPETKEVFIQHGMCEDCASGDGPDKPISFFCGKHNVPQDPLISDLEIVVQKTKQTPTPVKR